MNYLAHAFLSGDNIDVQLGGLLGDFVKGPLILNQDAPSFLHNPGIHFGIKHHRSIDAYSDALTSFRACAALLPAPYRRVAPIIVDIAFDHYLAKHWATHSQLSLAQFSQALYPHMARCEAAPAHFKRFSQRCIEVDLLSRYQQLDTIEIALERVGQRLSRPELMVGAYQQWRAVYRAMEQEFTHSFDEIKQWAAANLADHGYSCKQWRH